MKTDWNGNGPSWRTITMTAVWLTFVLGLLVILMIDAHINP